MTPPPVRCPKCSSENVIVSKKRGVHVCEDCEHEFTPAKTFVQKRLFISYGHDEHVSLAERLRDDLKARGHDVWFDAQRLAPGYDWEIGIEKGLEHLVADKANAAVVLLLTPHSVRRPDGYCLNEVARALSRGIRIIPLMIVESEPPLSICRIQWLDMRACIPIHEKEAVYFPRFERLVKAIEDDQLDFEGTQQRLIRALQPLEFDADLIRHQLRFTGRRWVFAAIERWLAEDQPQQRVFWISGGPGVGKTAIAAVLAGRYREVAAFHLCKFGHAQKSDPRSVVTSVAYQLSTQLPAFEARLAGMAVERLVTDDARTMFDNLLVQPLATLTRPERPVVILIDALDEATRGERNELAAFIRDEFAKTPPWLRLVVTSRPESAVTVPLQAFNPFVLDVEAEANRADIREHLRREMAAELRGRPDADRLVEQVVEKSEGVFLYVERVCEDLKAGNLSLDRLDEFPKGLGGAFSRFFDRQFPDLDRYRKDVRPALRAILAAREPLPLDILKRMFEWKDEDLRDFIRTLGSLFPTAEEAGAMVVRPYHKSVADWLIDESKAGACFVSVAEGHHLLGDYCLANWAGEQPFAVSVAAYHLHRAGREDDLVQLFREPGFHVAKFKRCGQARLIDDYRLFAEKAGQPSARSASTTGRAQFDDCPPAMRALYSIGMLLIFSGEFAKLSSHVGALRRFIEAGCDATALEAERQAVSLDLARAREAPRKIPRQSDYHAANTAHYYEDYVQHALEAVEAALALQPAQLTEKLWSALRCYAIYSCDSDPSGAIGIAIREAQEEYDSKLALLDKVMLRLLAVSDKEFGSKSLDK